MSYFDYTIENYIFRLSTIKIVAIFASVKQIEGYGKRENYKRVDESRTGSDADYLGEEQGACP